MGKKLTGIINLSKIPKTKIKENKNGEKILYIDIVENKNGADKFGNTHSIQVWDKDMGTIYLGNLKEAEFGKKDGEASPAPAPQGEGEDLPFTKRPR